jgi:hypothetical protein
MLSFLASGLVAMDTCERRSKSTTSSAYATLVRSVCLVAKLPCIHTARGDRTETERKQPYRPPVYGNRPHRNRHRRAAEGNPPSPGTASGGRGSRQHPSPPHARARSLTTSGLNFESTAPAGRPMLLFCCGSPRFKSSLAPCYFWISKFSSFFSSSVTTDL